jgi:hypothetical protein
MNTVYDINSFDEWILKVINKSEHPFVKSAQEAINYFFDLEKKLPEKYGWRYYDVKAFNELVKKNINATPDEWNSLYWKDTSRTIEAYSVTLCFRSNEVLRSAIRSLNNKEIVPAATLTRSLLELASTMIENSNTLHKTIKAIPNNKNDIVMISEDVEKLLLRMVWGRRIGNDIPEHLKQKNILTTLQRLSKNKNAKELFGKYEFLCEIAHPNWLGNVRFWSEDTTLNDDGSYTVEIHKKGYSTPNPEIIENIIWGISWSSVCVKNSVLILSETIKMLNEKFEKTIK